VIGACDKPRARPSGSRPNAPAQTLGHGAWYPSLSVKVQLRVARSDVRLASAVAVEDNLRRIRQLGFELEANAR
jgi:hypothetical protein